jgi:hypothetical protein
MMHPSGRRVAGFLDAWQRFWFKPVPAHVYALLRILFGLAGCATLVGLSNLSAFWDPNGFVPDGDGTLGVKAFLLAHNLGQLGGRVLYFASAASFVSMTVGYRSNAAVVSSLLTSLVHLSWNYLPLSGANAVVQVVLFCLVWADCGSVWSVDAWLARRRGRQTIRDERAVGSTIAPLRLIRFQIALVYLTSAFWKIYSPLWRDGSAVHYVLNSNVYHRFPEFLAPNLEWLATVATYSTLFWEGTFPFMLLFAPTRRLALCAGVLIHLGMFSLMEVGPFHFVMLSGYVAFLDPSTVPGMASQLRRWITGSASTNAAASTSPAATDREHNLVPQRQ